MSNLTSAQIQTIFDFTAKKYIKYYDVQLELVDHIAGRIEELQIEDPKLGFDAALHKVYKSFGIYGFTKVQEEKVNQMSRFWMKKFWSYYKSYFRLPKILLTIGLSGLFYVCIQLLSSYISAALVIYSTGIFLMIVFTLVSTRMRRANRKNLKSRYLIINSYAATVQGMYGSAVIFCVYMPRQLMTTNAILPLWATVLAAVFFSFMIINHYALNYVFPVWLRKEVSAKYGHLDTDLDGLAIV